LTEDWYIFEQSFDRQTKNKHGKRELIGTSTFKATFTEPQIAFNKRELTFRIDMYSEKEELQQTGIKLHTILLSKTISMKII